MGLLTVAMFVAGICRNLPIPYTVVLVIVGMVLSVFSEKWAPLAPLEAFQLSPDLVFFIFLPALIFESGFRYRLQGCPSPPRQSAREQL